MVKSCRVTKHQMTRFYRGHIVTSKQMVPCNDNKGTLKDTLLQIKYFII